MALTPFANLSRATEDEWIHRGILETLKTHFKQVDGLSVLPRISETTTNQHEDEDATTHVAALQLSARWVATTTPTPYFSYAMGAQRRVSGTLSVQRGGFFDGRITAIGYSRGRLEVSPQFSFETSSSMNRIELPEGKCTAKLATSRFTYTFTPRMFISGLLQYNSTRNVLSANVRMRWEYQPGSELFVVYNDQLDAEFGCAFPNLENRAVVVKATRLFRF